MRFLLLISILFTCLTVRGQGNFMDNLAVKYLTIKPEEYTIDELMVKLCANLEVNVDTIIHQTNSTFLYLRGSSSSFNPFSMSIPKMELQMRFDPVRTKNAETQGDTLLVLQLIGITDSSEQSAENIKAELVRIKKEIGGQFDNVSSNKSKKKSNRPFEGHSYYKRVSKYPFLSIGWGGHYANSAIHCISITFYYKMRFN